MRSNAVQGKGCHDPDVVMSMQSLRLGQRYVNVKLTSSEHQVNLTLT